MGRLSGAASFMLVLAAVFVGLRLIHVAIPMIYPAAGPGPYRLSDPARATELAGFAPWLPSYRPQSLGPSPSLVVVRLPRSRIDVEWRGDGFLMLSETIDNPTGPPPPLGPPLRLDGAPEGDVAWQENGAWHALARRGRVRVAVTTDLSRRDLERVLSTLRETPR